MAYLGTPKLLTDSVGQTVWRIDNDPFGKTTAINEDVDGDGINVTLNIRFPGQYYDAETGLHYNWNRYYDPGIGIYTSIDPIGIDGGLNVYAYVGGNPVGAVDPDGLDVVIVTGGGHGGNPFGHIAMAITGKGVYSYGTKHPDGSSFTDYLNDRSVIENNTLIEFTNLSDTEEQALIDAFVKNKVGQYSLTEHNCATVVNDSLSDAGLGFPYSSNPSIPTPAFSNTMARIYSALNNGKSSTLRKGDAAPSSMSQYNP